jgi:hypothetical protein
MSDQNSERPSLWLRLLWMVIVAVLLSLVQTLLGVLAVVQLILMAVNAGKPNPEIAAFGKRLGPWMAKAAAFQTAASEERQWPWAPLD